MRGGSVIAFEHVTKRYGGRLALDDVSGRMDEGESEVVPRTMRALEEVALTAQQTALPSELSFGERQRCAIARAVVNRPALVLADEPTGALEARSASEVLSLLQRIHREGSALLVG